MISTLHLDYGPAPPYPVPAATDALLLPPFQDNAAYLDARMAECKMRLMVQGWRLTQTAPSGFHMHIDEQKMLFGYDDSPGPLSWQLSWEEGELLQAQLRWVTYENQLRAQASLAMGISIPLERLRHSFGLSPFEERVLQLALAFAIHPSFQMLHGIFHPRAHAHDVMGPSVRTAVRILSESPAQQLEAFGYFAPDAPLRKRRLIVCQPPHSWSTRAPLEHYVFFLEPGVLLALLGHTRRSQEGIVSWPKDALDAEVTDVPVEIGDELREILARFLAEKGPGPSAAAEAAEAAPKETTPADALETAPPGASGAPLQPWSAGLFAAGLGCHLDVAPQAEEATWRQKTPRLRRWAALLASAVQRPLRHVRLSELTTPDQAEASDAQPAIEALHTALRDAQLEDAAVLFEVGAAWSDAHDHGARRGPLAQAPAQLPSAQAIRAALQGFTGLLLTDHADCFAPDAREDAAQRPVLQLSRDAEGQTTLTQLQGPPVRKRAQREGLKGLEAHLCQRVVGQDQALHRLAEVLRVRKAQVDANPRRPDGVFLLAGPSGVGKTETAKALNEALFGRHDALIRLDMSEFHFRESISGRIGSTPGCVWYEKGGRLTNAIQKNPESVVLLDEIEKAHPQVLDVFLQVFDDGRLTDGKGQTVDMSRATFLMTSNIGAQLFAQEQRLGFVKETSRDALATQLRRSLKKTLRPEFINRIDEILVYYPLTAEHMRQICHRALRALQIRFARKGIWLAIDEEVTAHITAQTTPEDGARHLQRHIEQQLAQPLAAQMLERPNASQLSIRLRDGEIIVEETSP